MHNALNSPYPIHPEDGYHTCDNSCITMLLLHHNRIDILPGGTKTYTGPS